MKRLLFLLSLAMVSSASAPAAEPPGNTFYVQLVRGSDENSPPVPTAKMIGPKLSRRLHGVFRWKNYWEMKHSSVTIRNGEKIRRYLSPNREVEIEMPDAASMTVYVYLDGKLAARRHQSIGTQFYITGGDKEGDESWFIVVRRDKPGEPSKDEETATAMKF